MSRLDVSYNFCQRIAQQSASNFCWAFRLLPKEKRRAMYALYAFARLTDDLADSDQPAEARRAALVEWRQECADSLTVASSSVVLAALADSVQRFEIPKQYLLDIIDGVMLDTTDVKFRTFDELRHYCGLVASAVGLACIHIWGFSAQSALGHATDCGVGFQLTNILRDLREDSQLGRIYLPREDIERFGVSKTNLDSGQADEKLEALIGFEADRAAEYYRKAAPLADVLYPDGRRVFRLMLASYWRILQKVRKRGAKLDQPIRIGKFERLILGSSIFRKKLVFDQP